MLLVWRKRIKRIFFFLKKEQQIMSLSLNYSKKNRMTIKYCKTENSFSLRCQTESILVFSPEAIFIDNVKQFNLIVEKR